MFKEVRSDGGRLLAAVIDDPSLREFRQTRGLGIRKTLLIVLVINSFLICAAQAHAQPSSAKVPGEAGEPYPNMPSIAPIGVRTGKYLDVPASARGPAIDPAKGYSLQ